MTDRILTFYLGGYLLGINVTLVKEINRNIEYTPIPGAKGHILGFFNMRGQIITLFDISKLLGLGKRENTDTTICIMLKKPKDPNQVGFLIDKPGDVIEVDREEYEIPPANIGIIESEYIDSIVKLKNELLIILEPEKIFNDQSGLKM